MKNVARSVGSCAPREDVRPPFPLAARNAGRTEHAGAGEMQFISGRILLKEGASEIVGVIRFVVEGGLLVQLSSPCLEGDYITRRLI